MAPISAAAIEPGCIVRSFQRVFTTQKHMMSKRISPGLRTLPVKQEACALRIIVRATRDTDARINELLQTATEDSVAAIAATIATAVERQDMATKEISRNAQDAANETGQVVSNIAEANRGIVATGSASAEVLTSAGTLADSSVRLKGEVEKFLTAVRAA